MDRKNIRLPEGVSALSGAVRLWPQRAVSDAIKRGQRLQFLFPWMLGGASLRLRARPGRRLRHDPGGVPVGDSKDARINRHKGRREIRRLAPLDFFSYSADHWSRCN